MLAQAQLPGHLGGLFLTNPFIKLQVAHLASVSASWKHTSEWLQNRGLTEAQAFSAIHTQQAVDLLEDLHTSNIWVDAFGHPCAGQAPGALLNIEQPLALEIKTLQGRLTNVLYDLQSKTLWYDMIPEQQARFLSTGGTGNGAIYRSPTKQRSLHLTDSEFQCITALRLGHPVPGLGPCKNRTHSGRECGAPPSDLHALSCNIGGGVSPTYHHFHVPLRRPQTNRCSR